MKRNPLFAAFLSALVPGSGQIYGGDSSRGAAILVGAIVVGNLNILILPLIKLANPANPTEPRERHSVWAYWIPRVVHDVLSLWSIVFWLWVVVDAYLVSRKHDPSKPAG